MPENTAPLASTMDVADGWRELTPAEDARARVLIARASAVLRARVPQVDARLASGALANDLVVGGIADAVREVIEPSVSSRTSTTGPFSQTVRFDEGARRSDASTAGVTFSADFIALVAGGRARPYGTIWASPVNQW